MKFSLLLYMLYIVFKVYPLFKKSFREKVSEQDCSVTISEKESGIARVYFFSQGRVKTSRQKASESDISLVWSDPERGTRYMMSPSPSSMTKAVGKGHLQLKGDASYFTWFLSLVKQLPV